ncbi:hypothetical protein [uncultured Aquitalea sp.]|uniref:hypothetical protein n=1 Tax=uncultured Aquitalea sp. TaxID=540272 RepID=UPI0025E16418|nr:hypothetical protein [uncultured Aquitalea sp.]
MSHQIQTVIRFFPFQSSGNPRVIDRPTADGPPHIAISQAVLKSLQSWCRMALGAMILTVRLEKQALL